MRRFAFLIAITLATGTVLLPVHEARADWDAAAEARDQARAKAARAAAAKRDAERKAKLDAAKAESDAKLAASYRKTYGERTKGMTDQQVLAAAPQLNAERARQANQQLAETIKSLPPEQRAMAEQMMKQAAAKK